MYYGFYYGRVTLELDNFDGIKPGSVTWIRLTIDPPIPTSYGLSAIFVISNQYGLQSYTQSLGISISVDNPDIIPAVLEFDGCGVYHADAIQTGEAESEKGAATSDWYPRAGDFGFDMWTGNIDAEYAWINHEVGHNIVEPQFEDTQKWGVSYSQVTLDFDTSDLNDIAEEAGLTIADFTLKAAQLRLPISTRSHWRGTATPTWQEPAFLVELSPERTDSVGYAHDPTGPILFSGQLDVSLTHEHVNGTNPILPNGFAWIALDLDPSTLSAIPLGQPIALRLWIQGGIAGSENMAPGDYAYQTIFVGWGTEPKDRPTLVLDIDPIPCELEPGAGRRGGGSLPTDEEPDVDVDVDVDTPDVPDVPDLPDFDVDVPDFDIPDLDIPDFEIPDFGLPPWAPFYWARFRGDGDFDILFDLREFETLRYTRRWRGGGTFEITFYDHGNLPPQMTTRNVVVEIYRNNVREFMGRIKWLQAQLQSDGRRIFKWTVRGFDLSDVVRKRLALPDPAQVDLANRVGGDVDRFYGAASAALAHYVWANAVEPTEQARVVPWLKIGGVYAPGLQTTFPWRLLASNALTSDIGVAVFYEARMQTVLQVLEEIATFADIGFDFLYDQATNRVYFVVLTGADRSLTNTQGYAPVLFQLGWDDMSSFTYTDDGENVENTIYVAGPGAGQDRPLIVDLLSAYSYDLSSVAQWGRQEAFISAQNINSPYESMVTIAQAYLRSHADLQSFSFTPIESERSRYRVHWDLGDIVTVRAVIGNKLVEGNVRIVEVEHTITSGEKPEMRLTLGTIPYTAVRRIIDIERQTLPPRAT